MSRQSLGVFIVLAVLGVLLIARAFVGDGMGRVYSRTVDMEMVKVAVPAVDPASVDEERSRAGELVTESAWVSVDSDEASRYRAEGDEVVEWTLQEPVPAREVLGGTAGADVSLDWARTIGIWVAALLTLAIFSFLYKDNPIYKTAESIVVGVSAGYWMVVGFWDMIVPNLLGKLTPALVQAHFMPGMTDMAPQWAYLIPAVFGVLLLMRLAPKGQWLSLWTLAFIVGTTAAIRMVGYIEGDFLSQVDATVVPVYQVVQNADGSVNGYSTFWASLRQLTLLVGVLTCLTYFFFSVEHKGTVGKVAKVGIWFLMITFGAAFGFTVMGRIALLAARFEFLFDDWLWIIDPNNSRVVVQAAALLHGG
ncbi:MAG: hypothetical protein VX726_07740 [Planctomycetota bacterium]|nr:hypothetical protein [Planctomycetota bacterium]